MTRAPKPESARSHTLYAVDSTWQRCRACGRSFRRDVRGSYGRCPVPTSGAQGLMLALRKCGLRCRAEGGLVTVGASRRCRGALQFRATDFPADTVVEIVRRVYVARTRRGRQLFVNQIRT